METGDTIAFVLIAFVFFVAIIYFIIKSNEKSTRVRTILKNHPSLVMTLLDIEKKPSHVTLSEEQTKKILSLTDSDWDEWEALIDRVLNIARLYPYALHEFINEHFSGNKGKVLSEKNVAHYTPIPQKVKHVIYSLSLEDLRKIDADSEATWKQRDDVLLSASKIKLKFPEGYKSFCTIKKSATPLNSEVVSHKEQIAELQKSYEDSKGYEGWEKKQEDFCSKYLKILSDVRSHDGRYPYEVAFKKPNRYGNLENSKFKIWQGFCKSYSSHLLNLQTDNFKARYNIITRFKDRHRSYYDNVYDNIFEIITKIKSEVQGDVYVVFIDRCKLDWPSISYDYHYKHLRELIDNSEIHRLNFSEMPIFKDKKNIKSIFILDFITSNNELMSNCKLIIEHFSKSVPVIGYYSMMKEYDEEELLDLSKSHEGFLSTETDDVDFIKKCLLQVHKDSYFSYFAIPNTWIGDADKATETKKTWLDNPYQFLFETWREDKKVVGKYSIDGGNHYVDIAFEGDTFNVDDTARFTHLLLTKMGILSQFKKNGQKAIDYMNNNRILGRD